MKLKTVFLLLTFLLAPFQLAHSAITLTESGAFTTYSYSDCLEPCNLADLDALSLNFGTASGGKGTISTSQSLSGSVIGDSGSLFAEATILGGLNTPLLRGSAESNTGKYSNIQATGIQGYTVTSGGDNQIISADLRLTGSVLNPQGNDLTGLTASAVLVKVVDPLDFLFEQASLFLLGPDAVNLSQTTTEAAVDLTTTLDLTVNQGDQFYLVATLGAGAAGLGANALSLSTLSVEFDSVSIPSLTAASVPLPASIWLFASVLVGLIRIRKK